jgi:hypothetical protein
MEITADWGPLLTLDHESADEYIRVFEYFVKGASNANARNSARRRTAQSVFPPDSTGHPAGTHRWTEVRDRY